MRRSPGRPFSNEEISATGFLFTTDLTLQEIATRIENVKRLIVNINQSFQIREYRGRRMHWVLFDADLTKPVLEVETGSVSVLPS